MSFILSLFAVTADAAIWDGQFCEKNAFASCEDLCDTIVV